MEIESLFSATRWDIIQLLSKQKLSPMELAKETGTTSANISQQLRLLELAGLIKSERIHTADKGKPRINYFLADDFSYLIVASKDFSDKKLIPMSLYQKFIYKSAFLKFEEDQKTLGKFYFEIEGYEKDIQAVAIDQSSRDLHVILVSDNKFPKLENKDIEVTVLSSKQAKKSEYSDLLIIHDPIQVLKKEVSKSV